MAMFQQLRGYLLDLEKDRATSPGRFIRDFLFDIEPPVYKSELTEHSQSIVDDGHPLGLGNPLILKNILRYLPASDLIKCRQVNLRWNHIACEYLKRDTGHCKLRPSVIKLFLKRMRKCFRNPFGSYAMRIDLLTDPSVKKFFRRFSCDIIRLRVKLASKEIPEFAKLLHKMPNLEELHLLRIPEESQSLQLEYLPDPAWRHGVYQFIKLKYITFESEDPSIPFIRNYDTCLVDVINSSPNLIRVEFINWDSHVARLFKRCGLSNPKSFDGWKYSAKTVSEDLVELFFEREMKFKALKFLIDETLSFDLVMDLTLKTCETLYHLSIKNDNNFEKFSVSLRLPLLLTLGLKMWKGPVDFSEMRNHFPCLTTLKINRTHFYEIENLSEDLETEMLSSPLLTTLETLVVMPPTSLELSPIDTRLMSRIVKLFPTVKKLFVQVEGNETLHVIYESYPDLELLCVDLRENISDQAFTGIPDEFVTISKIADCKCPFFSFPDKSRLPTDIGRLTTLSVLIIRSGTNITNLSLMEGISKLENLQTLWLLPSYMDEPGTQWCLRAIADSLKNLKHLVTSTSITYSEDDLKYLKERLPQLEHEVAS